MKGLRTVDTEKFKKYFSIIQENANKQGCIFFLDTGDGRSFESAEYELEDVWGWLIPQDKVAEFEPRWENWENLTEFEPFYVLAQWDTPDKPTVRFDSYNN